MKVRHVISVPSQNSQVRDYVRDVTTPVEGLGLVTPTRLLFERDVLESVVYHMKDGRIVTYYAIEEKEDDEEES